MLILKMGPLQAIEFPWLHPDVVKLDKSHQEQLEHARNFSEASYGAALLYTFMLAEAQKNDQRSDEYREALEQWTDGDMVERRAAHRAWDRDAFWAIAQTGGVDPKLKAFIETWFSLVIDGNASSVRDSAIARQMISDREWQLKRNRARLHNARALERWTGQSGAFQANYRWNRVRAIAGDIRQGLGKQP